MFEVSSRRLWRWAETASFIVVSELYNFRMCQTGNKSSFDGVDVFNDCFFGN